VGDGWKNAGSSSIVLRISLSTVLSVHVPVRRCMSDLPFRLVISFIRMIREREGRTPRSKADSHHY